MCTVSGKTWSQGRIPDAVVSFPPPIIGQHTVRVCDCLRGCSKSQGKETAGGHSLVTQMGLACAPGTGGGDLGRHSCQGAASLRAACRLP